MKVANRLSPAVAILMVIALNHYSAAGAAEPASYTDGLPPLPPGSSAIPNKQGHFVRCEPPRDYKGPDFKELCRRFLEQNRSARIGMPDPKYPIQSWIGPADYPRELLGTGKSGLTSVEVSIGPSGAVTDCRVVETSGTKELDEAVCNAAREKGRFLPRIGAEGKAQESIFGFSINWAPL